MIHVHATIALKEGRRADFLKAFHDLVPLVLKEEGCVRYQPCVDLATSIDAQEPVRDNVLLVVESWESVAALEAHLTAPHMSDYREKVGEMVEGLTIQVLEDA